MKTKPRDVEELYWEDARRLALAYFLGVDPDDVEPQDDSEYLYGYNDTRYLIMDFWEADNKAVDEAYRMAIEDHLPTVPDLLRGYVDMWGFARDNVDNEGWAAYLAAYDGEEYQIDDTEKAVASWLKTYNISGDDAAGSLINDFYIYRTQ